MKGVRQHIADVEALWAHYGLPRCLSRAAAELLEALHVDQLLLPTGSWDAPLEAVLSLRLSAAEYQAYRTRCAPPFFFALGSPPVPPHHWVIDAAAEARALRSGLFRYFSSLGVPLGYPAPRWLQALRTESDASGHHHFSTVKDFSPEQGDLKLLYEPSRFSWAYTLVRAASLERTSPETFWTLLVSWCAANPPFATAPWRCGYEVAHRVLAIAFALYAFWNHPSTTSQRLGLAIRLLALSARRIDTLLELRRRAQVSDHAIIEASALFTIALLFPELHGARRWERRARRVLEDEIRSAVLSDGTSLFHSLTYHREVMQAYTWSSRLATQQGHPLAGGVRTRLELASNALLELQDPVSGEVPNCGYNDSTQLFRLNGLDLANYRPGLACTSRLLSKESPYPKGPWDEESLWILGEDACDATPAPAGDRPAPRSSTALTSGGYYTLRGNRSWAMVRCHAHRIRPAHADLLHLDLWWQGINVLRDAGSFSYFDPEDLWHTYFPSTEAHNTVVANGESQAVPGNGFRWRSRLRGRWLARRVARTFEVWEGEHDSYRRLPCKLLHRRAIVKGGEHLWVVIDDLLGRGKAPLALHWHLADYPLTLHGQSVLLDTSAGPVHLEVRGPGQLQTFRGSLRPRLGWYSPTYGTKLPSPTVRCCVEATLPLRWVTAIHLGATATTHATPSLRSLRFDSDHGLRANVELAGPGSSPIVQGVHVGATTPPEQGGP